MIEPNHARYQALVELVAQQMSAGAQPKQSWLEEIAAAHALRPEWIAPPPPPPAPEPSVVPPPPPPPTPPRAAVPLRSGERVLISVDDDVRRVVDEILEVWGTRFCVFQSSGRLLELQTDPGKDIKFLVREIANPRMVPMNSTRAWFVAGKECRFGVEKKTKDGTPVIVEQLAPEWLGRAIVALPEFPHIPTLSALAHAPTLRPDGALVHEPGYDISTGILLASDLRVDIPLTPTQEDARAALAKLLDLVHDFDFINTAGKSAWLAGLLSVACRHTFDGPAPIFIIDASKRGSGKTTLADLASVIATGSSAPKMVYTPDDTEMDKRISALGIAGDAMVLIDNIAGKLASPSLDAALTSTSYQGRLLGKSEMTTLSMKIVWFATGNGLTIGADTSRRALFARLEPQCAHPEDRTGPRPGEVWKYPDLLGYAKQNRAELLGYALTLVSSYIQAGRPSQRLTPMGSFDAWSATIRSAIVWSGGEDPCATVKDARKADLDDLAIQAMVECWPVADGVEVTSTTLLDWAITTSPMGLDPTKREAFDRTRAMREMWRNALLEWLPAKKGDLPTAREFGYALRSIDGSIIGNFKIEGGPHTKSGIPWKRTRLFGENDENSAPKSHPQLFSAVK